MIVKDEEEMLPRCLAAVRDAVPAVAKVNLVEVRLENLVLRVALLHLARGRLLAQLARRALVGPIDHVGVHVPDELLRDGARAARVPHHGVLERADDVVGIGGAGLLHRRRRDLEEGVGEPQRLCPLLPGALLEGVRELLGRLAGQ